MSSSLKKAQINNKNKLDSMKTYTDILSKSEEVEGEYKDDAVQSEIAGETEAPAQEQVKFSVSPEYAAKIENSLAALEGVMSQTYDNTIRLRVEKLDCGIKVSSTNLDEKSKMYKSITIESNCVNDFSKDQNTGHSISKFIFKSIITTFSGEEVEVPIEHSEYWFDYDLNDWMVIMKK